MQKDRTNSEWFGEWFDSPYYHLLYRHRNTVEAQAFMDCLANFLQFSPSHRILDLACGKGRHAIYLSQQGYDVEGVDLSAQNIAHASQFAHERLRFSVHDMRKVYKEAHFDFILNMFTSFGYFDSDEAHLQSIRALAASLKPKGRLVIDFFNPNMVIHSLVAQSTLEVDGVSFHIARYLDNGVIVKDIRFSDKGQPFFFQERVRALSEADFKRYFALAGLVTKNIFGDYALSPFEPATSERMIFIAEKI